MKAPLTWDQIIAVMSAATVGDRSARVPVPVDADDHDPIVGVAVALNRLLDDLTAKIGARTDPASGPSWKDVFAVMSAASIGDSDARVDVPADSDPDAEATRFAIALNLLLDDLTLQQAAREKAEEQLRHSQKMEAIGRLAGGVAHDFNNLLSVVLSYSSILIEDLPAHDPMRGDLEEIRRAGERAAELTRQLLAFSRQQVSKPQVLRLDTVVTGLQRMIRRLVGEDIEVTTRAAPDLGRVWIDPGHLEQVLMNLIVNARDAMPHGGHLTIECGNIDLDAEYARVNVGAHPGPHVFLAVSDTGVGMDAATRQRLFEPYFTTKELGKGTGLGLSTVYGIIKQNDGSIWVYSEIGKGTTFKIYLPRTDQEAEPLPNRAPTSSLRGTECVLLVEDEQQIRVVAAEILRRHGYEVIEAASGAEAIVASQTHEGPIDLLLTDVIMPQMSGRQVAERVTELRPEVRVLYTSGYTQDAIVHHGVLDPGLALLEKPITPESLLRKVREVLE